MKFSSSHRRHRQPHEHVVLGAAILFLIFSFQTPLLAQTSCNAAAQQAFDREHWEEVTELLKNQQVNACNNRLAALALFHSNQYDTALPQVQSLLNSLPNDPELNRAALAMLTALGREDDARASATTLHSLGDSDFANLYTARIEQQAGNSDTAESLLRDLLAASDAALAQAAASDLIALLQSQGRYREIPAVASQAYDRNPDSFSAYRFEQYSLENQRALRSFEISAGYRLDYDDNVALYPDDQALFFGNEDQEDFRNVFFGDLWYRRSLGRNLRFFSEVHASQSIHLDYSEYDLTRINVVAGLGGSYARWGWRLPLEYTHDRFDGDAYNNYWAATPGIYFHLPGGLQSHFYGRFREDDYEQSLFPSEDRSGDTSGGGVLLVGALNEQWFVRVFAESDAIDTDGRNWDRDEWRAVAQVEYSPAAAWTLGAGYGYQEADFDNIHDVFLAERHDETSEIFASVTWRFARKWLARAQVTFMDQDSTLPVYTFDRTVISLGVNRDF